jgi:hypothetical protein
LVSASEIAAPFLITALVAALGSLGSLLVIDKMEAEYERILADAKLPTHSRVIELRPSSLASTCNWAIDGSTIIGGLLGPGIGLVLLYDDLGAATIVIYSVVIAVAVGGFFLFLARVPVSGYPNRQFGVRVGRWLIGPRKLGPITPIAAIVMAVNLLVGGGLFVFGQ